VWPTEATKDADGCIRHGETREEAELANGLQRAEDKFKLCLSAAPGIRDIGKREETGQGYVPYTYVRVHAGLNKLQLGVWHFYTILRTEAEWLDNRAYTLPSPIYVWVKAHKKLLLTHPADKHTEKGATTKDLTTLPYDRALANQARRNGAITWLEHTANQATCPAPNKKHALACKTRTYSLGNSSGKRRLTWSPAKTTTHLPRTEEVKRTKNGFINHIDLTLTDSVAKHTESPAAAVNPAIPVLPSCRSLKRNTSNYNRSVSITGKTNFGKELAKKYQDPENLFRDATSWEASLCIDGIADHSGEIPKVNKPTPKPLRELDETFRDIFEDNSSESESLNFSSPIDGIFGDLADLPSPVPINTGSPWCEILSTESDSESTPKWK